MHSLTLFSVVLTMTAQRDLFTQEQKTNNKTTNKKERKKRKKEKKKEKKKRENLALTRLTHYRYNFAPTDRLLGISIRIWILIPCAVSIVMACGEQKKLSLLCRLTRSWVLAIITGYLQSMESQRVLASAWLVCCATTHWCQQEHQGYIN